MTPSLIIMAMPALSVAAGMWFGRNAPFQPEYARIG
jgi:hypothetical protein